MPHLDLYMKIFNLIPKVFFSYLPIPVIFVIHVSMLNFIFFHVLVHGYGERRENVIKKIYERESAWSKYFSH